MNTGEAIAIFKNIYNSERPSGEKMQAIETVIDSELYNNMTKEDVLDALCWLYSQED